MGRVKSSKAEYVSPSAYWTIKSDAFLKSLDDFSFVDDVSLYSTVLGILFCIQPTRDLLVKVGPTTQKVNSSSTNKMRFSDDLILRGEGGSIRPDIQECPPNGEYRATLEICVCVIDPCFSCVECYFSRNNSI